MSIWSVAIAGMALGVVVVVMIIAVTSNKK